MKHLTQVAKQIKDGNLDAKVEVKGSDEIAELAEAVNEMVSSLKMLMSQK